MVQFTGIIAGLMAMASGDFAADFDSYPNKHQLHGVDGWYAWDNVAAAGAQTSTAERRSLAKSVDITATSDLVKICTATGGKWQLKAWQYIPSSATGENTYLILMNTYNAGGAKSWSTQMYFNLTNSTVSDNMGGATGSVPLVRNQWVPIVIDIDLDARTQTLYYNSTKVTTVGWNRLGGTASIAAIDLYGSKASHVYYDDVSLTGVVPVTITSWREVTPDE